jgi:hypothetical protein
MFGLFTFLKSHYVFAANISESMLCPIFDERPDLDTRMHLDLVSRVLIELSEPRAIRKSAARNSPTSLSQFGVHFTKQFASASYSFIFEVCLLIGSKIAIN